MNAQSSGISSAENVSVKKTTTLNSLTLTFSSNSVYAGHSVTATVIANYSDGTSKDVTSESSISGNSKLSVSGSTISSIKAIGCLGNQSVTASYGGKNISADLLVVTDFKAVSLTCELTCEDNHQVRSGDGSSTINLPVPMNDGGDVTADVWGTLTTIFNDSYNILSSSYIKVWYENDLYTGVCTDNMMPGDELTFRIEYLGETVKSWMVRFY